MNIVVAFGGGSGDGVAVTAESTRQCEGCIVATTPDVCGGSRWTGTDYLRMNSQTKPLLRHCQLTQNIQAQKHSFVKSFS